MNIAFEKGFFQWSGGKDSALAYYYALKLGYSIPLLVTSIQKENQRVSFHGLPKSILEKQVDLMNQEVFFHVIPEQTDFESYEKIVLNDYEYLKSHGFDCSFCGDVLLEDVKAYRTQLLNKAGLDAVFPIWGRSTQSVVEECIHLGIRALIVAVNNQYLDASWIGKELNLDNLKALPQNVDPGGENGEFHTMVVDAPFFETPLDLKLNGVVERHYKMGDNSFKYYFGDFSLSE